LGVSKLKHLHIFSGQRPVQHLKKLSNVIMRTGGFGKIISW